MGGFTWTYNLDVKSDADLHELIYDTLTGFTCLRVNLYISEENIYPI